MTSHTLKTVWWLTLFAVAMGFLESAVVIYLRELYYPGGFSFPLHIIPSHIAQVELCREAATIIMLVGAGYLAGTTRLTRFAYFLIAFAVWDIFYYVFLYLFLQWPESLFTWDILFLIPVPWTGPVIAPCLVALGMAVFGCGILAATPGKNVKVTPAQWLLLLGGCAVVIASFMYDYFCVTRQTCIAPSPGLFHELQTYIPQQFNWPLYLAGLLTSCSGVVLYIRRSCF